MDCNSIRPTEGVNPEALVTSLWGFLCKLDLHYYCSLQWEGLLVSAVKSLVHRLGLYSERRWASPNHEGSVINWSLSLSTWQFEIKLLRAVVLRVWSYAQQHPHCLRTCETCRFLSSSPDLLNQDSRCGSGHSGACWSLTAKKRASWNDVFLFKTSELTYIFQVVCWLVMTSDILKY